MTKTFKYRLRDYKNPQQWRSRCRNPQPRDHFLLEICDLLAHNTASQKIEAWVRSLANLSSQSRDPYQDFLSAE